MLVRSSSSYIYYIYIYRLHVSTLLSPPIQYSHDLKVERKGPKIDLFTDQRDTGDDDEEVRLRIDFCRLYIGKSVSVDIL